MKQAIFATNWLVAGLAGCLLLTGTSVLAQTYTYNVQFERPVPRTGAVPVSGITWNCAESSCVATGPWPTPAVGACNALARTLGNIRYYGHPGSQLSASELAQCNVGAASGGGPQAVRKIAPESAAAANLGNLMSPQARRQITSAQIPVQASPPPPPASTPAPSAPSAPAPTGPTTTPGVQIGLEEGSLGVYRLYVVAPDALRFQGGGPSPASTPVPEPRTAVRDGRVALSVTHNALGPFDDGTARGALGADSVSGGPSGLTVELTFNLTNLPSRVLMIETECSASSVTTNVEAPWSVGNSLGGGTAVNWNRDGNIVGVTNVPLKLMPFTTADQVGAVQCQANFVVSRTNGGGIDRIAGVRLTTGDGGVAGLGLAPGSVSSMRATTNLER